MDNDTLKQILDTQKKILDEIDVIHHGDPKDKPSLGQRLADKVVSFIGSWKFIIIQSIILLFWIVVNVAWLSMGASWDPYPFILLNLILSFQAAYASPLILMAQNRADEKDRRRAQSAYRTVERIEKMLSVLASTVRTVKEKNGTKNKRNDAK